MQNKGPLLITAAYNRNYKTFGEALADWKAGKDFKIVFGPYCSIRDIAAISNDFGSIWLRLDSGLFKLE